MATQVVHDAAAARYELIVDGERTGVLDYDIRGDAIYLTHTEIERSRRGGGLGAELVHGALDQVRSDTQYRVVASCPFVADWIDDNPGFRDLLSR